MGRKRTNKSDVGTRFEEALVSRFGSVKGAGLHYGIPATSINNYIGGSVQLGLKWQLRLESEGINFDWVKTGQGKMLLEVPHLISSQSGQSKIEQLHRELMQVKDDLTFYKAKSDALEKTLAPHIVQTIVEGLSTGVKRRRKK